MSELDHDRRSFIGGGGAGLAGGLWWRRQPRRRWSNRRRPRQAAGDSQLRTALDRGHLIVGTGSTNAPWHFEDDQGKLTGMDIAMARILAKGLFDDETKVEFVLQDPAARIPNVISGKVDITIQFMTVTPAGPARHFTRPYYIEGVALLSKPAARARSGQRCRPAEPTPRSRSCRTSTPSSACTRPCGRRRCCSSTRRPT